MRHFYIFKINEKLFKLSKNEPDLLFNTFNYLHNLKLRDLTYGILIYDNIINPLNKKINNEIYAKYENDVHYIRFKNIHIYNDYFNKESSRLTINNSYLKLDTSSMNPTFFNNLNDKKNMFVCDFDNDDYFWLESIA